MKKILFAVLLIITAALAAVYIFIPEKIIVRRITYAKMKPAGIVRTLHDSTKWANWFPRQNNNSNFIYNHSQYNLQDNQYGGINISILNKNGNHASAINVIPINIDSSAIEWGFELESDNNPFKRFFTYTDAKKLSADIDALLDSMKLFIQNTKNIYGYNIYFTTLTDTALVSAKTITQTYPSTQQVYLLIDKLKSYIAAQHAQEHNYPMLNITTLQDGGYEVKAGIPTNILLKGNDAIEPKRMVMIKNKTLVTDVFGDNAEIKKAIEATNNFMTDNQLSSPVIPFQQLITDRKQQPDSTKWRTKIFTPII